MWKCITLKQVADKATAVFLQGEVNCFREIKPELQHILLSSKQFIYSCSQEATYNMHMSALDTCSHSEYY
jgi:hypothetical protein